MFLVFKSWALYIVPLYNMHTILDVHHRSQTHDTCTLLMIPFVILALSRRKTGTQLACLLCEWTYKWSDPSTLHQVWFPLMSPHDTKLAWVCSTISQGSCLDFNNGQQVDPSHHKHNTLGITILDNVFLLHTSHELLFQVQYRYSNLLRLMLYQKHKTKSFQEIMYINNYYHVGNQWICHF